MQWKYNDVTIYFELVKDLVKDLLHRCEANVTRGKSSLNLETERGLSFELSICEAFQ